MSMIKNISKKFGDYFKRMQYDPTINETANCWWDETNVGHNNAGDNVSASGRYSNRNLPLDFEGEINRIKRTLKNFDELLPNLKK